MPFTNDPYQRMTLAAFVAGGVVRVHSSMHENPQEVARISLAVADEIIAQAQQETRHPADRRGEPDDPAPAAAA